MATKKSVKIIVDRVDDDGLSYWRVRFPDLESMDQSETYVQVLDESELMDEAEGMREEFEGCGFKVRMIWLCPKPTE